MKQNKKNSTFKPLWKKPAFIISALIVSVSVFAFGLNKKGQEKETKKELPTVAVNSNLTESHVILSLRPIDIMTTPQTLMNVWINEPIPLDQYSEKEKEVQQLINEKTTDGIITYSPLNGNKEYLDIDHEEITPYTWKWIKLELKKPDGTLSKISLRRPNWWIKKNQADKIGNSIRLILPEMGINGDATVTKINANQLDTRLWDENRKGDYVSRPITGKFEHQSSDVANYYFKGLDKPIGATSLHPFWSVDRNDWVAIGELEIGETVKTKDGITQLTSKEQMEGLQIVYNLEIYKEHNYFVSNNALLVHNNCITNIAKKYKNFQCMQCADEIVSSLKSKGLKGEILDITTNGNKGMAGNVWSDKMGKNIATNGRHRAVLYDGKVYDNIFPEGISYDKWVNDIFSPTGYNVTKTKF